MLTRGGRTISNEVGATRPSYSFNQATTSSSHQDFRLVTTTFHPLQFRYTISNNLAYCKTLDSTVQIHANHIFIGLAASGITKPVI